MIKVLLVDDDADIFQALETTPVFKGHRVRMARSGADAFYDASLYVSDIIVNAPRHGAC